MTKENQHLEVCKKLIEEKLDWGSIDSWKSSHYIRLGKLIFDESHINLSKRTLERIFKSSPENPYNPQIDSKDALAIFLGFKNWDYFILDKKDENIKKENLGAGRKKRKKVYLLLKNKFFV